MRRELCALLSGAEARADNDRLTDLVALARIHRVHLIVATRLARLTPRPRGRAYEELAVEARVEALRDTLRVQELERVTAALEAEGCAPVVFKGAALALTHYPDSWLRPRVDADILVDPERRARAASTLGALGYTRPPMTSGRYVMHQEMHVRVDPNVGEHVVDLHWRLANPNLLAGLPPHAGLRARAVTAGSHGGIRVASPADALVIACVHRAAHHAGSDELLWFYDIHLVAARLSVEEWALAVRLARQAGVAALVRRGLELAADAFGPSGSPSAIEALAMASGEASAVFLHADLRPLDRVRADMAALGAARGARLVAEHLFPPPSYMREKYGLRSDALLPLAYARRIVGGAGSWFRRGQS